MQGFDINLATAEKLLETLDEVYAGTLSAHAEIAEIAREQHEQMRAVIRHYMQIDEDLARVKDALAVLGRFVDAVEGKPEVRASTA